jgi:hypothetical protein
MQDPLIYDAYQGPCLACQGNSVANYEPCIMLIGTLAPFEDNLLDVCTRQRTVVYMEWCLNGGEWNVELLLFMSILHSSISQLLVGCNGLQLCFL